ncbi:hypothetical protein [Phenylobacterium sp.]|uniref:DUF7379 domain-containing protein n=1 Tax=Phenylobacterium sp. TaxID=1871053 RepID=UPI0025DCD777|nr:hypothetical protein [Phenylobacterium sp.]
MAQVRAGPGVTVTAPANVQVTPRAAAQVTLAAAPGAPADRSALGQGLLAAGFTLVADFDLRPVTPSPLAAVAASAQPVTVSVDVAANEGALLLLETPDGVFAWNYTASRQKKAPQGLGIASSSGPGAATLTFQLSPAPAAAGALALHLPDISGSSILNWVVKKAIGAVRTRVLKFVIGKLEDLAVDHVEGKTVGGLTSLASDDVNTWTPGGAPIPPAPAAGPRKILLMVHGTFSNTNDSYSDLLLTAEGKAFLASARAGYDAVLGFDHKTLGVGAAQNAADMLAALEAAGLPQGSTIDAVAYSRGGLVYRAFAETLLAAQRPDIKLGKAAFLACTNAGTHLAEPENWHNLVDLYTNIAMAAARVVGLLVGAPVNPLVNQVIGIVGQFVQYLSVVAIDDRRVPGLADMEPSSDLVTALNTAPGGLDRLAQYFAITSNFEPTFDPAHGITHELEQMLEDTVTDQLIGPMNDLVVDTPSMTTFGTRGPRLQPTDVFGFGTGELVYHTTYFTAKETPAALSKWLFGA